MKSKFDQTEARAAALLDINEQARSMSLKQLDAIEATTAELDQVETRIAAKLNETTTAKLDQIEACVAAKLDKTTANLDQMKEQVSAQLNQTTAAKLDQIEARMT